MNRIVRFWRFTAALAVALIGHSVPLESAAAIAHPPAAAERQTLFRADVDGDGHRDTVRVWMTGRRGSQWEITVRTAAGRIASTLYSPDARIAEQVMDRGPLFGMAPMDGRPGAEIVLRHSAGAHSSIYHVLTWRSGKLALLNAPDTRDPKWMVDGAAGVLVGYRFSTSRGVHFVTLTRVMGVAGGATLSGTATTYRWTNKGWQKSGTKRVKVRSDQTGIWGFHGVALPRPS